MSVLWLHMEVTGDLKHLMPEILMYCNLLCGLSIEGFKSFQMILCTSEIENLNCALELSLVSSK